MKSVLVVWSAVLALAVGCDGTGQPADHVVSAATPAASPSVSAAAAPTPVPTATPALPQATATPPAVTLAIHMHAQQDPDWCDPADLQTWLELDGIIQPADAVMAQRTIWDYEVAHNDGFTLAQWHASPYAVAAAFDHFSGRTDVGDQVYDDADSAGVVIARSVALKHEPVIALIDDGNHYVLISGVTLGMANVNAPPTSVIVDDPWAYGPVRLGYPALGLTARMSWSDFVRHLSPDDPQDVGIWSGHRVLIAAGLPLRG